LLYKSIEQMTGLATTDDNDGSGRLKKGTCVTVKTHFPTRHVSVSNPVGSSDLLLSFERLLTLTFSFYSQSSS
jgi:hypothetical protein